MQSYRNLKAVQISPTTFPTGCFTDTLRALSMCLSLQRLTVNSSCTDEVGSSALVTIGGLKYLALMDPTRAILNILPDWLSRLSGSLTELHLEVRNFTYWTINTPNVAHARKTAGLSHRRFFVRSSPSFNTVFARSLWDSPTHLRMMIFFLS